MKSFWKYIISKQGIFYKSLLILASSLLILYIFPFGGQFKYEFQKGRAWQYPDFYSPFDFSILKTDDEINNDKEEVLKSLKPYLRSDISLRNQVFKNYSIEFYNFLAMKIKKLRKIAFIISDFNNLMKYTSLEFYPQTIFTRATSQFFLFKNKLKSRLILMNCFALKLFLIF